MQIQTPAIERRSAVAFPSMTSPGTITGTAVVYNSRSRDLGGFTEVMMPGCFTRSLSTDGDVLALYDHQPGNLLGKRSTGSLRLMDTPAGLSFELDLPDTTLGRDVRALVSRGELQMSFGFAVPAGGDAWTTRGDSRHRTVSQAQLFEISVVALPAYAATTVKMRSSNRERFLALRRWRASVGKV